MGQRNAQRLLDSAVREGYSLRRQTYPVTADTVIDSAGSYFVDASSGPVTLRITDKLTDDGWVVNVKKIDHTTNGVIIKASSSGTIDGESEVDLHWYGENLQIQLFRGVWRIL